MRTTAIGAVGKNTKAIQCWLRFLHRGTINGSPCLSIVGYPEGDDYLSRWQSAVLSYLTGVTYSTEVSEL